MVGPDGDRSLLQVSFKNYEKGPERIQVGSGTFQSFALGFILPSVVVGTFLDPATGERARSNSKTFRQWRNDALCRNGWPQLVASFEAFDVLND